MKLRLIVFLSLCVFGFGLSANAGTIADTDSDSVPDVFDNCSAVANGPANSSNQIDADSPTDGYGNACDADFTGDGVVAGGDFSFFAGVFGSSGGPADITGDGVVAGGDFSAFAGLFGGTPGPSGLSCAGTPGCL